ncbi:MAG: SPFH domain-containing protein [Verrucomicrobia bacterium]|nr:SPFH domain-containing protein [Verrucomicrobiota bacterium]
MKPFFRPSSPASTRPSTGASPGSPGDFRRGLSALTRQFAPSGLALLVLMAVVFGAFLYLTCTQYIEPDQFAVKQVDVPIPLITGPSGIQTNIYGTGVHWRTPGCEKFLVFPRSVRAITLHTSGRGEETRGRYVRYEDAAHIQTSDGFFITLDVSILYRVVDPYRVVREFGAGSLYEQNGIILQAEPTLKATMGTLHPEDFFDAAKRVAKQNVARDKFNEFLEPRGLRVEHVLIRYPKYHEAVQARIEARNIQEQTRQKNVEEAKLAQAQAALNEVIKRGEASLAIKLMEGTNQITRLTAQMEAYKRKRAAEGNRVVALAEAEKQRLLNEAYRGEGAERLLGFEWARVLSGLDTIVLPAGGPDGFNPLDIETLMRQLKLKAPTP